MDISNRLKDLRRRAQWTQQQVADYINVTRPSYAAYEEGRACPPLETLRSLAEMYSFANIDQLLGWEINDPQKRTEFEERYRNATPEVKRIVDFALNIS